jgi:hypothetical protein
VRQRRSIRRATAATSAAVGLATRSAGAAGSRWDSCAGGTARLPPGSLLETVSDRLARGAASIAGHTACGR